MVEGLKIVAVCIVAAVVYGVLHDLVTAHVMAEYFSEWHPNPLRLTNPIQLALLWGVIATWWMGATLGVAIAISARAGSAPKLSWRDLLGRIGLLLLASAVLAALAGAVAYPSGDLASRVFGASHIYPGAKGQRFESVLAAHNVSYLVSFFGGVLLCLFTLLRRNKLALLKDPGGVRPT